MPLVVSAKYRSMVSDAPCVPCGQAVKQTVTSLTSQLAGTAEKVSKLQQQQPHPAASDGSNDSSDESALKQRLRRIELTVAGQGPYMSSDCIQSTSVTYRSGVGCQM